jgi:hypothetical protein
MLSISFKPDTDTPGLHTAVEEYKKVWSENGGRIKETIESITGIRFKELDILATVLEGKSRSHPLTLRSNITLDRKKATLIHELCHRIIKENRNLPQKLESLGNHKELGLILYDIWEMLYGADFAKKSVESEFEHQALYKEAWYWALSFDKEERAKKFKEKVKYWKQTLT